MPGLLGRFHFVIPPNPLYGIDKGQCKMVRTATAELNPRQAKFVQEYLLDLNAARAYRAAGYKAKGEMVAESASSRLLKNVKIATFVNAALAKRATEADITIQWVTNRLKREADFRGEGSSHGARVRAAELLGKRLQYFPPEKVELAATVQLEVVEVFIDATPNNSAPNSPAEGNSPPPGARRISAE